MEHGDEKAEQEKEEEEAGEYVAQEAERCAATVDAYATDGGRRGGWGRRLSHGEGDWSGSRKE